MALPCLAKVVLRLVSEITLFLLDEPCHPSLRDCLLIRVPDVSDPSSSSIIDHILTQFANTLGLSLPRDLTLFGNIPTATAYLLRLTEVLPSELLLFLVVIGLVSSVCVPCIILLLTIICCRSCRAHCSRSSADSRQELTTLTNASSPSISLSDSPAPPILSDLAQTLSSTVNANNVIIASPPCRTRRRSSSSSRY